MSYVPAVQNQNISYTGNGDGIILKSSGSFERLFNEIPKITIKGSANITKKNSTVYIILYRLNPITGICNKIIHTKINKKREFNIVSNIEKTKTKNDAYLFIIRWDLKDNDDVQIATIYLKTPPSTLKSNFLADAFCLYLTYTLLYPASSFAILCRDFIEFSADFVGVKQPQDFFLSQVNAPVFASVIFPQSHLHNHILFLWYLLLSPYTLLGNFSTTISIL